MIYGYTVKKDGVLYSPGTNVPDETHKTEPEKPYTKTDISRMSASDLKELAPKFGIEVTEESTGAKLKEEIIAKLGL